MIHIDGSYGEGGGQILRTSLALSAVTGTPCAITDIRKNRPNPGLQTQHLEAMKAVAELCGAEVRGLALGSTEVEFHPQKIQKESLRINIQTAGSVALTLQPLMIAAVHHKGSLDVEIHGGATNGKWAAPANYVKHVLCKMLEKMNYETGIEIERYGYYPKGGARVTARMTRAKLRPIELLERGMVLGITGISHASSHLAERKVAERQATAAKKYLDRADVSVAYVDALNPGSGIELFARTENSVIGADALGEISKKAEDVGKEAGRQLHELLKSDAVIDGYLEDQLLPYMALAVDHGESRIKVPHLTNHTKTNIWVIEKFLDVEFKIDEKERIISCRRK